jgi:hypothetical protein
MIENEIIDSGVPAPRISNIRIGTYFHLEVTWAEGERAGRTDYVDLLPAIDSYKVYRPLRNNEPLFSTARLIDDGFAVQWGASDIDMSADAIEVLATESMSPAEFADFLRRNKLTQQAAATMLGRSRRQIGYYLNPGPVPRIVALACFGYEALMRRRENMSAVSDEPSTRSRPKIREIV